MGWDSSPCLYALASRQLLCESSLISNSLRISRSSANSSPEESESSVLSSEDPSAGASESSSSSSEATSPDVFTGADGSPTTELEGIDELENETRGSLVRRSPRRDRIRGQMNFLITKDATQLVEAESTNEAGPAKVEPTPETQAELGGAEPVPWWQAFLPVIGASTAPAPADEERKEEAQRVNEPPPERQKQPKGFFEGLFGTSEEDKPKSPRSVLPQIPPPPSIPALNEVNSYYSRSSVSENPIELLGPRPLQRFEGRVRGWPRRLAPYWSSHAQPNNRVFQPGPSMDGVSALAMFRVT